MLIKSTHKLIIFNALLYSCLSNIVLASNIYSVMELGYSSGHYDNAKVSTPFIETTSNVADDQDSSYFAAFGVGYDWDSNPLRTEIVYRNYGRQEFVDDTTFIDIQHIERTTVKVKQESIMLNLIYDIDIGDSPFTPYVGIGIGGSKTKVSATQKDYSIDTSRFASFDKHSSINLAWDLVAGVNYKFIDRTKFGLGYRYTDAGEVATDSNCVGSDDFICDEDETHSADLRMHSLFVNFTYYY